MAKEINITLKVWRQENSEGKGRFELYQAVDIDENASFLEMLDIVNERLIISGEEPIVFDHDCREGICGSCGTIVNGRTHGSYERTTLCQLHMRKFKNNDTIVIEPFKAKPFKIIKDLIVDRSSFDKIISSGGYISVKAGSAPEANSIPISNKKVDLAMDSASCIACGACVAACPNGSAMLFTAAKISQMGLLPQGQLERSDRVQKMVARMDEAGFGNCSNEFECVRVCPKGIDRSNIARLNRDFIASHFRQ